MGGVQSSFQACHDVHQMRLGNAVESLTAFLFTGRKAAMLHQSKMFGSHMAWNFAGFSQFPHGILPSEQHLNHPKPMRMHKIRRHSAASSHASSGVSFTGRETSLFLPIIPSNNQYIVIYRYFNQLFLSSRRQSRCFSRRVTRGFIDQPAFSTRATVPIDERSGEDRVCRFIGF